MHEMTGAYRISNSHYLIFCKRSLPGGNARKVAFMGKNGIKPERNKGGSGICPHGRSRYHCKECGGSGMCLHGVRKSSCKECGGSGICPHGREKSDCKECGGSRICPHGRVRYRCKECGGAGICPHGREKSNCKECKGSAMCEHRRQKCYCKECGGSGICAHGRRKHRCKECSSIRPKREEIAACSASDSGTDNDGVGDKGRAVCPWFYRMQQLPPEPEVVGNEPFLVLADGEHGAVRRCSVTAALHRQSCERAAHHRRRFVDRQVIGESVLRAKPTHTLIQHAETASKAGQQIVLCDDEDEWLIPLASKFCRANGKSLVYVGEINSTAHAAKRHTPYSAQFGLFAAEDLDSRGSLILGEYVGLVETAAFKDENNEQLGSQECMLNRFSPLHCCSRCCADCCTDCCTDRPSAEYPSVLPARNRYEIGLQSEPPLVIDAMRFCNETAFVNSYQGIARQPNARFVQLMLNGWPHVLLVRTRLVYYGSTMRGMPCN